MKWSTNIELDDIGVAKEAIGKDLLTEEANKVVSCITETMDEENINASYTLRQSIEVHMLDDGFTISMNDYWKYVNEGVAGVREGYSRSGYAYKKKRPPINAIYQYIANKGLSQNYLYAIREKIYQRGIKPREFIDKAIQRYYEQK